MGKEILNLKPKNVWKHFYDLTQIPRPTGHTDKIEQHIINFAKQLSLNVKQDDAGNVLITKPASKGMENAPTVILQAHLDMVPQKNTNINHNFEKDPIDAYIDGAKVTARSTTLGADNGVGVAAILAVLEDSELCHPKLEGLFTIDEEEGACGAFGLKSDFVTGKILLNLDTEEEGVLCVGCAGGVDEFASWQFKEDKVSDEDVAVKISITGLKGGHSGCDIHLGRANANKLLFRVLKEAVKTVEARLALVDGGSLLNAIPREAFAIVTILPENVEILNDLIEEYSDIYSSEYQDVEPNLTLHIEKVNEVPKTLIPEEIQDNLINAIEACPNGVMSMLQSFPEIVESSINLASIKSSQEKIEVQLSTRSSLESRRDALDSSIESLFSLAGAKVKSENAYPGWQPDISSTILKTMKEVYYKEFGKEPVVEVIHAGLECGIILDTIPDLDIVSFGPTIVHPHSPDEFVDIKSVEIFYRYLTKILEEIR